MQLLEAMKKRRSVREFNAEVPSKEEIQAILVAAYLAPALFTTKDAHISGYYRQRSFARARRGSR